MPYVVMTPSEETQNLKDTLVMLNDTSERREDWRGKNWSQDDAIWLRHLLLAWIDADRELWNTKLEPEDRTRLNKFIESCHFTTDPNGMLHVVDYYNQGETAAMNFTRLVRNSQKARLRAPCPKCLKWYISKTKGISEYCSRKCAGGAAKAAERKRRRERLFAKARKAIENYKSRPKRFAEMSWKDFVAKAIGTSKKMLTVAVRNGELLPPKEGNGNGHDSSVGTRRS